MSAWEWLMGQSDKDYKDFDQRLSDLKERTQEDDDEPRASNMGIGFKIGIEIFAGCLLGFAVGYGIDEWVGSRPWGMIICFILGATGGMWNAWKTMRSHSLEMSDDDEGRHQ